MQPVEPGRTSRKFPRQISSMALTHEGVWKSEELKDRARAQGGVRRCHSSNLKGRGWEGRGEELREGVHDKLKGDKGVRTKRANDTCEQKQSIANSSVPHSSGRQDALYVVKRLAQDLYGSIVWPCIAGRHLNLSGARNGMCFLTRRSKEVSVPGEDH